MGSNTPIEWTHHTDNIVRGCTKISAGCKNCYAEALAKVNPHVLGTWGPSGERPMTPREAWLAKIERLDNAAAKAGEIHRVFVNSMWDPGEGEHDSTGEGRNGPRASHLDALAVIVEAARRFENLRFLMLTKRTWNLVAWWDTSRMWDKAEWPERLWVGTSVENQAAADERIPHLLRIPARVRFLSMEPLLGAVDLTRVADAFGCGEPDCTLTVNALTGTDRCDHGYWDGPPRASYGALHWVIVGGESGRHARPMHPDWARALRDQCVGARVPFFFKQWGEFAPVGDGRGGNVARVGKATAGRLLDGREWSEVPRG